MKRNFLFLLLILGSLASFAQSKILLSGKVSDTRGKALPYASISLNETQYGTITDDSGRYVIKIPRGEYQVVVDYLGYATQNHTLNLNENLNRDFQLTEEAVYLDEVIISPDGRDPAYTIMRLAINRKKQNSRPYPEYQYQAYTKTSFGFREGFNMDSLAAQAEAIFGGGKDREEDSLNTEEELPTNIFYLSENLSQVSVREPNKVKEDILSSRVSGASDQFSFLGNLITRFNPYKNRTVMQGIADRGLVSPLSDNSFFFYEFKLLGTLKEGDQKIYKIQLWPKRKVDPAYEGLIYIADSSYAVKELDFTITRTQSLDLLDTLKIRQDYMQVGGKWLPFQSSLGFALNFKILTLMFPLEGTSLSMLSDYNTQPAFDKKIFGREVLAISDSALNNSVAYWDSLRPIPLSIEEAEDFQIKDSIEQVHNSPEYLDSLSAQTRKVSPLGLVLGGHTTYNYRSKDRLTIYPLLNGIGFNPMEGWFLNFGGKKTWGLNRDRSLSLEPFVRYGFSSKDFGYKLSLAYTSASKWKERIKLSGGDYVSEFSRFSQIDFFLNTFYALFAKRNFLKLYRKQFVELDYSREVLNGFTLKGNARYENRINLPNESDYSFFKKDRVYTPNITIPNHQALVLEVGFSWNPFNRYITTPDGKLDIGSSWPTLEASYTRAIPAFGDSASDYDRLVVGLRDDTRLGLLGTSSWRISAGSFFGKKQVYFPDLFHFKGNETFVRDGGFDEFFLLPYYENSSTLPFVEAHLEHAFGGFLMNKIPGIRKLKLKEYVGAHYLLQEDQAYYLELSAGIEFKILRFVPIRFDVNWLLNGDSEARRVYFKIVAPISGGSGNSISIGG